MEKSLLAALRRLGLTEYEARAYIALLGEGRSSPVQIASASGVPRTRIYEVLKMLQEKGFATIVSNSPRLAEPISPEHASRQSMKRVLSEMQEVVEVIISKAKGSCKPEKKQERIILSSRKSIARQIFECAHRTQEILVWGVPGWFFGELDWFPALKGKKMEMVVSSFEDTSVFIGKGIPVFVVKRVFFTGVFIIDRHEVVAFPYIQAKGRLEGMWTSHHDSVESFLSAYLDHRRFSERI